MSRERIAQVLKEKRKIKKMSVEEVSGILKSMHGIDISAKTLYSYETGHRQPDADLLMALCDIYGVTDIMGEFRDKQKTSPNAGEPTQEDASRKLDVNEVINSFIAAGMVEPGEDLTDEDLRFLISIIDAIRSWFAQKKKGR